MILTGRSRVGLAVLAILLTGGSISFTSAYGFRIGSESYRRDVEVDLTEFFEMPCDVGNIRGSTFSSRVFEDVSIYLPDRRDRIFHCKSAVWEEEGRGADQRHALSLHDGVLLLGSDRWERGDYRQVFESGLGHDFEDLRLDRVQMDRFEVAFARGGVSIRCCNTSGTIDMSDPQDGVARLHAYELNGHAISQGVQIHSRFSPRRGVQVREVLLTVPEVPLSIIGLDALMGVPVRSGRFAGSVQFTNVSDKPELWLRGDLRDANLSELTARLPIGPIEGALSVTVYGARVAESIVTDLRGEGRIRELVLAPIGRVLTGESLDGRATLEIDDVDISKGTIHRLRVSGLATDLSIEQCLKPWGRGRATGRMSIRINNLNIAEDNIQSADIVVTVSPPSESPGTIDRDLVLSLAKSALDFSWPSMLPQDMLPESIEYREFGIRLLVQDNQLQVLGTHGRGGNTILTITVGGVPFEVLRGQNERYDLQPWIAEFWNRVRGVDEEQMREWLKSRTSSGS